MEEQGCAMVADQDSSYPNAGYAWLVTAMLSLAAVFAYVDRSILNLLIEPIKGDLQITDFQFSLLQGLAFSLFYTLMGVPIARLADRKNRRNIIAIGIFLWSAMTVLCGMARSYGQLFFARVGVGVGEAALFPTTFSLLTDYFPKSKLGRATSAFVVGSALGGGIAFFFGGLALDLLGEFELTNPLSGGLFKPWQIVFIVVGAPGLVLALAIRWVVREPARIGSPDPGQEQQSFGAIKDFIRLNKKLFLVLFMAYPPLLMVFQGWVAWAPTFLIRTYDLSISQAGYWFGTLLLTAGIAGTLLGGVAIDYFFSRGYRDAALRISIAAVAGISIFGSLAPMMVDPVWGIILMVPFVFLGNLMLLVPPIIIQLSVPNQMRAQVSAVFLLVVNLIAMGLGPSVVAAFTDYVFADPAMLKYSLTLTTLLFCPITAVVLVAGLKPFRESMEQLGQ